MNKNELEALIEKVDEKIKNYSQQFSIAKEKLKNSNGISISLLNERTLAYFTTNILNQIFGQSCIICINEMKVTMPKLSSQVKDSLRKEVSIVKEKRYWEKDVFVDSYFAVKDLYYEDLNNLFVEYKLSNKFEFVQLAQDYLKYKIYTHNSNKDNNIFAYIIFKKEDFYPTILNNTNKFVLLDKCIQKNNIQKDAKIFIRLNDDKLEFDENKIYPSYLLLDNINKISQTIESWTDLGRVQDLVNDTIFLKNIGIFKNNVAIANILVNNSKKIQDLFKQALNEQEFKNYIDDLKINSNYETPEEYDNEKIQAFLDSNKNYFKHFESHYGNENKLQAVGNGLNVSYKSSLNIIIILKIFARLNNLEFKPNLPTKKDRSGKEISYEEISNKFVEQLIDIYRTNEKEDFDKLAVCILFYLTNLYNLITTENDNGNTELSNSFKEYKKIMNIQDNLNELLNLLKIDQSMNVLNDSFKEDSLAIINSLIQ